MGVLLASSRISVDPQLDSLFATSLAQTPSAVQPRRLLQSPTLKVNDEDVSSDEDEVVGDENVDVEESLTEAEPEEMVAFVHYADEADKSESGRTEGNTLPKSDASSRKRKRRRGEGDDDLEDAYMQKLNREMYPKVVANGQTRKRRGGDLDDLEDSEANAETGADNNEAAFVLPKHETQDSSVKDSELEKASRTVFLGNVSTDAIKAKDSMKELTTHLSSFLGDLPAKSGPHRIESFRFRSTAFASAALPKKAAFAKKELLDATTKSTNAYVVYSTPVAAREAAKRLNGTIVLHRHLRADSVAHPMQADHRRCVFVGNLAFVDDESLIQAAQTEDDGKKRKKGKDAADIEEGIWHHFSRIAEVESVRVIRDKATRVGKGFAYVQFMDGTSVEKALLMDGKKRPPMLPRPLRVTRAKKFTKIASQKRPDGLGMKKAIFNPKISSDRQTMQGRVGKLLGRAGAAQVLHGKARVDARVTKGGKPTMRAPEDFVFEGHRASGNQGKGSMKLGGSGKQGGKPRSRSSKRGAAFKASGGMTARK